jgi:predicted PurR-regulated permease PerM
MGATTSATFIYFMRIDFPILSGFLFFTFSFVPEIGSVVAAMFPIIFCFLKFGFSWQLFVTIIALLVINSTFGNYLEPKLMGYQFNLSPILIIFVLILWGWIWGPIGMLLAVPITAMLNIVFKELDKFKEVRTILNLKG